MELKVVEADRMLLRAFGSPCGRIAVWAIRILARSFAILCRWRPSIRDTALGQLPDLSRDKMLNFGPPSYYVT